MNNLNILSELRNIQDTINSDIFSLLNNKLRFQIISYLLIFNELSMSELSRKLNKSKSTLHRYIKLLTDLEFIELSKEKKVRGSIKAKYYKLSNKFLSLLNNGKKNLNVKGEDLKKDDNSSQDQIDLIKFSILMHNKPLELLKKILDFYSENIDLNYLLLNREIKEINPKINIMFLTERDFEKLNEKLKEINFLLNEIKAKKGNISTNEPSPYVYTSFLLNLNNLLKFKKQD